MKNERVPSKKKNEDTHHLLKNRVCALNLNITSISMQMQSHSIILLLSATVIQKV